jgi:hypothetical protein
VRERESGAEGHDLIGRVIICVEHLNSICMIIARGGLGVGSVQVTCDRF